MKIFVIISFFVGSLFADTSSARLYWTDRDDDDGGLIESSDLDGGNRVILLDELSDPRGIAVDPTQDKIFWASHEANGAIYWANCDGSEAEIFIGSLSGPADLLLDLENRMIYWAAEGSGLIQGADLDGSRTVSSVVTGLVRPYYLALDDGLIYWSYFNSGVIERASVEDGGGRNVVISGQQRVRDIEIADGVIYWCDRNSNQLRRRDLDATGAGTILFTGGILNRPHGLVLDPETNTMFWTDTDTELIGSSSMDGTGALVTLAPASLTGPWAIDLVRLMTPTDPFLGWQNDHFTEAELGDLSQEVLIWGVDADPDGDGRSNLLEYAQGSDPRSGKGRGDLIKAMAGETAQVVLRLKADDPVLTYVLESTVELSAESWEEGVFQVIGDPVLDPEDSAYQFLTLEAEVGPKLFVRLRVMR